MAAQRRFAYISLTPIMLYVGFFALLPMIWVVVLSFFSYTPIREGSWFLGLGGQNPFIGFDNFVELIKGVSKPATVFRLAVANTFLFAVMVVPLNLAVTLPLAVMLESINERVKNLFRMIYFLPAISSGVAIAIIWSYIYAPGHGLLSTMIRAIGLNPPKAWLSDPTATVAGIPLAMICTVVVYVWMGFGFSLVTFIAALQGIPRNLREAARVDGANPFQEFWFVVVPLLNRTVLLTSVGTMLSSLQEFTLFQQLTRGGPRNQTQTILLSIYENAFTFAGNLGLAAAMSMLLFVVLLVLTVIQFRMLRTEWEY
jgi:ABC-type sugar transport system permease subunit